MVRKPLALGEITVALRITAVTPAAGTPPWPVTWTSTVELAGRGPEMPPMPLRVSRMRAGVKGV